LVDGKKVTAIILAAGNSARFGRNRNKNFEEIKGKTILAYSINAFNKNMYIDDIILAIKENEIQDIKNIISKELLTKNMNIIIGGSTRQESVYNCIMSTNSDIVIIHDGARPLIKQEYINKCIENINEFKGVTIGTKAKDTIKIADNDDIIISTTNRNNTWITQTPQCFDRKILLKLHEKYKDADETDDCSLLEKENYKIKMILGDYTNIKITTYEDLAFVKGFINGKYNGKA